MIANYQKIKIKIKIKWWWFFSFLFRYTDCKVGNLCILNKVYKDDSSFQYMHTHTHVCVNVCMYIYMRLEFLFIQVSICNSSHQTKIYGSVLNCLPLLYPQAPFLTMMSIAKARFKKENWMYQKEIRRIPCTS